MLQWPFCARSQMNSIFCCRIRGFCSAPWWFYCLYLICEPAAPRHILSAACTAASQFSVLKVWPHYRFNNVILYVFTLKQGPLYSLGLTITCVWAGCHCEINFTIFPGFSRDKAWQVNQFVILPTPCPLGKPGNFGSDGRETRKLHERMPSL